jgi:hypothetical protein
MLTAFCCELLPVYFLLKLMIHMYTVSKQCITPCCRGWKFGGREGHWRKYVCERLSLIQAKQGEFSFLL